MYRTSANVPTHKEPWATVIRLGLQDVMRWLWELRDDEDPWTYDIPVFDRLTLGQKLWLLQQVGRALLIEREPRPELTAVVEATAAVIFEGLRSGIEYEIDSTIERFEYRTALLKLLNSYPSSVERPNVSSDDLPEWEFMVQSVVDQVLWDEDFLDEFPFLDVSPEQAAFMKEAMDVTDNYFTSIPPDPPEEELGRIADNLMRLAYDAL